MVLRQGLGCFGPKATLDKVPGDAERPLPSGCVDDDDDDADDGDDDDDDDGGDDLLVDWLTE